MTTESNNNPAGVKSSSTAEEQCAPEEGEYCIVDERSGKLIKLTVAEKERIFLDALQVCVVAVVVVVHVM